LNLFLIKKIANGRKYEGNVLQNSYNGVGTYHFENGNKFSGDWAMNKKHGIVDYSIFF
jgi:hypothetical protein